MLVPEFETDHPQLRAKVVAVGSGEAIDLGRRGDADVLLVHSPRQEEEFMSEGLGTFRKKVMRNNFEIVGPAADPAKVSEATDATDAFGRIAATGSRFISRGDESGTHQKELQLWEKATSDHAGNWYSESGQGMAESLAIAAELSGYVLTDSASFIVMSDRIPLKVLFEGDPFLANPYSVMPVKNARHGSAALAFADWITGSPGQAAIRSFGVRDYGRRLFEPDTSPE
jgi:tungstate transport system substrate-binding protein